MLGNGYIRRDSDDSPTKFAVQRPSKPYLALVTMCRRDIDFLEELILV